MVLIMEVRLMTTSRSAEATSAPKLKALLTTAKKAKRNKATAKEPMVSRRRTFLRKRLAKMMRANFMRSSRQARPETSCPRQGRPYRGARWYWHERQPKDRG